MSFTNPIWNDLLVRQIHILCDRVKRIEDKLEIKDVNKELIINEVKLERIEEEQPDNNEWVRVGDLYKKSKKKFSLN
jgi:hypothetical protein